MPTSPAAPAAAPNPLAGITSVSEVIENTDGPDFQT